MNKLLKSRKALSPVIASIILIAVTVAVSIAVAAWMGALTFSFTKTPQFNVASCMFYGTSGSGTNYINITLQNTGSSSWTLTNAAQINGATTTYTVTSPTNLTTAAGGQRTYKINGVGWITGNQYSIVMLMTDGTKVTWVNNAP